MPTEQNELLEGIVAARQTSQRYVGRSLLLQENGQTLPEVVNDEDKEHTTLIVTRVKHFQKSFLWPQVQECIAFRPQSFWKGAQRWRVGPHLRHLELDSFGDEN